MFLISLFTSHLRNTHVRFFSYKLAIIIISPSYVISISKNLKKKSSDFYKKKKLFACVKQYANCIYKSKSTATKNKLIALKLFKLKQKNELSMVYMLLKELFIITINK